MVPKALRDEPIRNCTTDLRSHLQRASVTVRHRATHFVAALQMLIAAGAGLHTSGSAPPSTNMPPQAMQRSTLSYRLDQNKCIC